MNFYYHRTNGAERRSGRKPGTTVTNSALEFTYIMRSYIAQWHSGMKVVLHFGFGRWTDFVVMRMHEYQARDWLRKRFCFALSRLKFNGHFENIFFTAP